MTHTHTPGFIFSLTENDGLKNKKQNSLMWWKQKRLCEEEKKIEKKLVLEQTIFFPLSLEQIIIGITASSNLYLELQIKQKKY